MTAKKNSSASVGRQMLLNRLVFAIALWGIVLSVHFWIQSERGFSHGCFGLSEPSAVESVECSVVVDSDAGKLLGVSNITYGFLFFGVIAVLSFATLLTTRVRAVQIQQAAFLIGAAGVAYAIYLFSYQVFYLGTFCKLCITTGATAAVLFGLLLAARSSRSYPTLDVTQLVRETGWFVLMTFVATIFLVAVVFFVNRVGTLEAQPVVADPEAGFFESESPTDQIDPATDLEDINEYDDPPPIENAGEDDTTQAVGAVETESSDDVLERRLAATCRFDDSIPRLTNFDQFTSNSPATGSDAAEIQMVEFFDPNCPHCKTLHERMPEILAPVRNDVRLHYRPFPLWPYSYSQVEALYLAEDAGFFDAMLDEQMEQQQRGGLSISELTDIAQDIGMDAEQFRRDLSGGKYRSRVNRERLQVSRSGVRSVPKVAIEGRFVSGRSLIPACMDYLVEQVRPSS